MTPFEGIDAVTGTSHPIRSWFAFRNDTLPLTSCGGVCPLQSLSNPQKSTSQFRSYGSSNPRYGSVLKSFTGLGQPPFNVAPTTRPGASHPTNLPLWMGLPKPDLARPSELGGCDVADKRLLRALESVPGRSWYGPISCGAPLTRFFAVIHDLRDCGIAAIYCNESKTGPAEIVAVIPGCRRSYLREEFAFEFLAFARFLGSLNAGAEFQVHDAISSALATPANSETVVFSIGSGLWPADLTWVQPRSKR